MNRWLAQLLRADADPKIVIGPRPQVIGPKPSTTVQAPARFAWDEKQWRQSTSGDAIELIGRYRVFDESRKRWREFDGRLVQHGTDIAAYVADPPQEIRRHRHGACLQLVNPPWFRLHWQRSPKNLDQALLYLERMLDESLNRR